MHPNWVLDEYWKIQKLQNLRNFVIYPKPDLDASTGFETCSNRFFAHKNPNLSHNFAKNKNSIFRHFCFFVGPKMALFVHCWRFDSACHNYLQPEKVLPNFQVDLNSFRGWNSLQTLLKSLKMTNNDEKYLHLHSWSFFALETYSNRFFALENPYLHVHFVKNRNSIFRHFSWFSAQKRYFQIEFENVNRYTTSWLPMEHPLKFSYRSNFVFMGFQEKSPKSGQKWSKTASFLGLKNRFFWILCWDGG